MKILLIDDDEINNFISTKIIKKASPEVVVTQVLNGLEAIDYLKQTDTFPDVILLDDRMPVIDGWDFLTEYERLNMHRIHPKTIIIMLMGSVFSGDLAKAKNSQLVSDLFSKPLSVEKVKDILKLF